MTTPGAGETDRSLGASGRSVRAPAAVPAVLLLLLAGLALRLIIAYVVFPKSGFETDIATFAAWALKLAADGPPDFYAGGYLTDYPPGYMLILWLVGRAGTALAALNQADPVSTVTGLLKLPAMAADIGIGALLYRLARGWLGDRPGAQRLADRKSVV